MDLHNDPIQPQMSFIKPQKPLKKVILLIIVCMLLLGMITGIFIMDKGRKSKIQGIWMKVPFQDVKPTVTDIPTPIPTKDPTSDWKTYLNNSFNIKYPARFKITELELPYTTLYPKIYSSIEFSDEISKITITAAKNTANFSINSISGNGPFLRYSKNVLTSGSIDNIKLNNTDALVSTRIPAGKTGIAKEVLIISSNKVYQITLSPLNTDTTAFDTMLNTFQVVNQEPSDITENWQVYTNSYYGYSIKFPTNYGIDHEKNASISALTIVYNPDNTSSDSPKFKLEVQDIRNITLSNITSRNFLGLPLDQYVTKKWEYNKASNSAIPDKIVSAIKESNVSGKIAYQFSVTNEFRDDRITEKLTEEYLFYFTESGGYKYKIWFPKAGTTFSDVFKTLTFIK